MTEELRIKIIKVVSDALANKASLERLKVELKELSHDKAVQAYLTLYNEILDIERDIHSYDDAYGNKRDSIKRRVNRAFRNNICKETCTHELWLYEGTYYECEDFFGSTHYTIVKPHNKKVTGFAYKKYACIECGKVIMVNEDEEFEDTHNVLIDERQIFQLKYYQDMYYQLLFQGLTTEEAFQEIQKEFESNKNSQIKKRNLKQGN